MLRDEAAGTSHTQTTSHTSRFDDRWKDLTMRGNDAFDAGELHRANKLYALAYHEARIIFSNAWNGRADLASAAAPMMVVSAGNAARLWETSGRADMGLNQLTAAVRIFLVAIKSQNACRPLQSACAEHVGRLISEIELRRSTAPDMCDRLTKETSETVLAFLGATQH
ncbi:MAG: hypothetical protein AAGK23_03325 [Pseudomonadota bacterium]